MGTFNDKVAMAIEKSGIVKLDQFSWIRKPKRHEIKDETLLLTTEPETDLWMRTFYPMVTVNAPVCYVETDLESFTFTLKTEFSDAGAQYDQCGVCVYLDDDNWLKASVESGNESENYLGAVVNTDGYSDWSSNPISPSVTQIWYQLTRKGTDFQVMYSLDSKRYSVLRACHMKDATGRIKVGMYACSPSKEGQFTAIFSDLSFSK